MSTWLHRVVVNACLDRLRRRAARPTVPLPGPGRASRPRPGTTLAARETALDVQQALAALPVEQRAALVLVDLHGLPVEEAAQVLGVPVGTVKSRCSRGRARLAVALPGGPGRCGTPPPPASVPLPGAATVPRGRRRSVSGHLDLDALADLLAGEGDDAQVDHVAGCATCSAALVDLDAGLGGGRRPRWPPCPRPQVPDGLAARLDAALRAERRRRGATAGRSAGAAAAAAGRRGRRGRPAARCRASATGWPPGRRRPLLLGAAAAAAAVVLGGAAVTAVLQRGSGTDSRGGERRLGAAGAAAPPQAERAGRRARREAGADYGPGTAGLAEALPGLLGRRRRHRHGPAAPARHRRARRRHAPTPALGAAQADGLGAAARPGRARGLPGGAARPGVRPPLALDYARYDGAPGPRRGPAGRRRRLGGGRRGRRAVPGGRAGRPAAHPAAAPVLTAAAGAPRSGCPQEERSARRR